MTRFVVYANADGRGYLLDVQANLLRTLNTRVVVPLLPEREAPSRAKVLNPVFDVEGAAHVMATQFMAAVPISLLQREVLDLGPRAHEVVAALDCLFQGV